MPDTIALARSVCPVRSVEGRDSKIGISSLEAAFHEETVKIGFVSLLGDSRFLYVTLFYVMTFILGILASFGHFLTSKSPPVRRRGSECSLKALILEWTPKLKWAAVCEEIGSGAKAHNMDFLKGILNRRQCSIPDEIGESLEVVRREWITDLRYVGALIPFKEAEFFIEHVSLIDQWAERST